MFYSSHNGKLAVRGDELFSFVLLSGLLEQDNTMVVHQVFQEFLLLVFEKRASLGFEVNHLF